MKLFTFLLFFVFGLTYSQSYQEGTNPLAPTLPPPISHAEKEYLETQNKPEPKIVKFGSDSIPLSENVKNYQHEQSSEPLKDFREKDLKFNNYDSPPVVDAESSPSNETKSEAKSESGILGLIVGNTIVIIFVISLMLSRKKRKY